MTVRDRRGRPDGRLDVVDRPGRRLARAAELLLVVIAMTATALVFWHGTVDRSTDAERAGPSAEVERSLEATLETDLGARRAGGPGTAHDRPAGGTRSGGSAGSSSPSTEGPWVAGTSVAAVLLLGLWAIRLVLQRRDRSPSVVLDRPDEQRGQDSRAASRQPPAAPPPTQPVPPPEVLGATASASGASATSGTAASAEAGRRAAATSPRLRLGSEVEVDVPLIPGERLFEQRAAVRVAYDVPGELELRGHSFPVRLHALSESGLRCESGPSAKGVPTPKAMDYVRVRFAVPSGTVDAKAQVAWRKPGVGTTELGLTFLALPAGSVQQIREGVAASTAD